jgi:hypothetical protein
VENRPSRSSEASVTLFAYVNVATSTPNRKGKREKCSRRTQSSNTRNPQVLGASAQCNVPIGFAGQLIRACRHARRRGLYRPKSKNAAKSLGRQLKKSRPKNIVGACRAWVDAAVGAARAMAGVGLVLGSSQLARSTTPRADWGPFTPFRRPPRAASPRRPPVDLQAVSPGA